MLTTEHLAEVFVEVADTLVDDFEVIDFLQLVTTHTSELVPESAVGLLLVDAQQRLQVMAASDDRTELLELFQIQWRQGPCQDCFTTGQAVAVADLGLAAERWPQFAPRAVETGFRSVHAFPLRLRGEIIGALNLFGPAAGTLPDDVARVLQALADVATIGLLQERAIRRSEQLTEQLQQALNSRIAIEQAKGALAQLHRVSIDQAFELLRTYCRRNHLRMSEVARSVVADPGSVPELTRT